MLGILLIDKPLGISSHDVVNQVRRRLGTRRVGHAGTLDPMASGLLVVAVGPATRFLQYLPLEPKEYVAKIHFGRSTATQDVEGETIFEGELPENLKQAVEQILPKFIGAINQIPPMYSAIKKAGKPLYVYAREGVEIKREQRTIYIHSLEIDEIVPPHASIRVTCSGGTYVRTLAHDMGEALGCGAHLAGLRRTGVGSFTLSQAISLNEVAPEHLISLKDALPPMPLVVLDTARTEAVRQGQSIVVSSERGSGLIGLIEPEGQVFSVARLSGNLAHPECVIPREALYGAI